ncbi:MAG: YbjN domain-containing protein [Deltaproteobacteria bacterium]|jgi:hypothetical protein|nr:YbjN domain-containing protein [Deltaproteobacteria bacterium]
MRKFLLTGILLLGLAGLAGQAAAAELISAKDAESILNMAKGFGSATLDKDKEGDPKITGRIDGMNYGIYFFGCKSGKDCDSILFATGWTKDVKKISLAEVNKWNQQKRFGHAFIDRDEDAALQMDVHLSPGMAVQNLEAYFQRWQSLMNTFRKEVISPNAPQGNPSSARGNT